MNENEAESKKEYLAQLVRTETLYTNFSTAWRGRRFHGNCFKNGIVVWLITPYRMTSLFRHFGGTCCLHLELHHQVLRHLPKINSVVTLEKEAAGSTETSEQTYVSTRCNNTDAYQVNVYYSLNKGVAFYITLAL
jgi:hypothetical protein